MSTANPEEIKQEVKKYTFIFIILLSLSFVTVGISYLPLNIPARVFLALAIAAVQVFFAAGYFMHLISERTIILYVVLAMTVGCAVTVLALPSIEHKDPIFGTTHTMTPTHLEPAHTEAKH
jgi:caa(3)-type oxidase subunit IV